MKTPVEEERAYPIWIDHTNKIVSFNCAGGFEQLQFSSQEEKLAFAMEQCSFGYCVQ